LFSLVKLAILIHLETPGPDKSETISTISRTHCPDRYEAEIRFRVSMTSQHVRRGYWTPLVNSLSPELWLEHEGPSNDRLA
jgi:hypothetical protein